MGWSGHVFNKNGDMIFFRGGDNGFSGAYLKIGKQEVQIEYPEIFESIFKYKAACGIMSQIEKMSASELLKRVVILPEEGGK